jgi:tetratricopeptide (TPR) repeat protein
MQAEEGDFDKAVKTFEESLKYKENIWALRNIAYIYVADKKTTEALRCYKRLFELPGAFSDQAFSEEYLSLLLSEHKYSEAWEFFKSLPAELKIKDRIALQSGAAAVELNELEYVEKLLQRDFAVIREGENSTSDIWFKYKARKLAEEKGIPYTRELLEEVMLTFDPPKRIDFRMHKRKTKAKA